MKKSLLALPALLLLTACASMRVVNTEVSTVTTRPEAIYIRPFSIDGTCIAGHHSNAGASPIRASLIPLEFAKALKLELEKIAPARVLADNEAAPAGWLVDGHFEVVNAGNPVSRFWLGIFGVGRSEVVLHVRVSDVNRPSKNSDGKAPGSGKVVYEFDVAGGSGASGKFGSIYAPGAGYATPFDLKNAAERIYMELEIDPHQYGNRTSPTIR